MFRVPAVKVELASAIRELKARGLGVLATSSHKGTRISQADLRRPMAVLVGKGRVGAPKGVLSQADEIVAIPQSSRVESLNAGIAASTILTKPPGKGIIHQTTRKRRGIESKTEFEAGANDELEIRDQGRQPIRVLDSWRKRD